MNSFEIVKTEARAGGSLARTRAEPAIGTAFANTGFRLKLQIGRIYYSKPDAGLVSEAW